MPDGLCKAPHAILFDLDNTLCTFVDAKRAACDAVIKELGVGDRDELFSYFLRPVRNFEDPGHISDYLADIGAFNEQASQRAEQIFVTVKLNSITLYPDVLRILPLLQSGNIQIAMVTDAHSTNAHKRMVHLSIDSFFPILITPDISGKRKPDHTPFLMAMEILQTTPERTWVVGDSLRREIEPCLSLGLTTIYARYGDWIKPDLPHVRPHHILDSFSDLISLPGLSHLQE
jgi:putative hydrolase of the HAD superfamily